MKHAPHAKMAWQTESTFLTCRFHFRHTNTRETMEKHKLYTFRAAISQKEADFLCERKSLT